MSATRHRNGDQTATSGTLSLGATGEVWTGNIPPGGTVTITGSATVNNPDTGNHCRPPPSPPPRRAATAPPGQRRPRLHAPASPCSSPALTITNTANTTAVVPGSVVSYTLTITDTGQTPYTGVTVTEALPSWSTTAPTAAAAATAGALSYTAPVLTWTGSLAPGATATVTFTVTVNNPDTGDKLRDHHRDLGRAGVDLPGRAPPPRRAAAPSPC